MIDLEKWALGEIEAKNIITQRLSPAMCPSNFDNMSAKQIFDSVAGSWQETATAPYANSLETIISIRFVSTADDYIGRLLSAFQAVNNAADAMST